MSYKISLTNNKYLGYYIVERRNKNNCYGLCSVRVQTTGWRLMTHSYAILNRYNDIRGFVNLFIIHSISKYGKNFIRR